MTPLKTPITVEFKSVESAIIAAALHSCGSWILSDVSSNLRTCGIEVSASRLNRLLISHHGKDVKYVTDRNDDHKITRDLKAQGIDWLTWEPPALISIGEHTVEFKPDGVQVGYTFVPRETVLEIAKRLEAK